ncbi:hypothetical protein ATANTOWER_005803 [Ataeniobius toweri]|uniref:Uncharacterized protein n=1 Tax=Ataeniobius toweri TaxID=208326 RepID=A0ABU7AEL2_9TELE|nr:hypothetical protein [Ataeniobius toweri]
MLSHAALGCSFNLLPLYQANSTGCLSKRSQPHGCTPGFGVRMPNTTRPNLCSGPLYPSCLPTVITQDKANTSKIAGFIGHRIHTWGTLWLAFGPQGVLSCVCFNRKM